jgi:hypothetical protein
MSFRKKGRNFRTVFGKTFPNSSDRVAESEDYDFTTVIAETLQESFGGTHAAVKTVMGYTLAGERTVKNWFEGKNGPNGENLVELIRHSDAVLEAFLQMAGREEILAGKLLVDARDQLAEMLEIIDRLKSSDQTRKSPME